MSEDALQMTIVEMLHKFAAPDLVWFHVPNAPRSAATGARLKRMGMRAGVSDLVFIKDGKPRFLELKWGKGRTSAEQDVFMADAKRAGAECALARTPEYAASILHEWGELKINPFAT